MEHRGRIQAQGGGTEKSVPWTRDTPPTVTEGLQYLEQLKGSLTPAETFQREDALDQARLWIERAGKAGGVSTCRKTFPRLMPKGSDLRVDVEVLQGTAFIPDPIP